MEKGVPFLEVARSGHKARTYRVLPEHPCHLSQGEKHRYRAHEDRVGHVWGTIDEPEQLYSRFRLRMDLCCSSRNFMHTIPGAAVIGCNAKPVVLVVATVCRLKGRAIGLAIM